MKHQIVIGCHLWIGDLHLVPRSARPSPNPASRKEVGSVPVASRPRPPFAQLATAPLLP